MLGRLCIAFMVTLYSTVALHAANKLSAACSDGGGQPGTRATITLSLDSGEALTALQVSFTGLGEIAELDTESARTSDRAAWHTVTAGTHADGNVTLLIYSTDLKAIASGQGQIATFDVILGNNPESRFIPIQVKAIDANGEETVCPAEAMNVTILAAKAEFPSGREYDYGRVPIRGSYDMSIPVYNGGTADLIIDGVTFDSPDFECMTDALIIAPGSTAPVNVKYSPLKRGLTNTMATLSCNSAGIENSVRILAVPYAVNYLQVHGESGENGSEVTIALEVSNMDDITGFTFEFDLPKELRYVEGSASLTSRKADHQLSASLIGDALHLTGYSLTNTPFSGNEGSIAEFKVVLSGRYGAELKARKTVLSAIIDGEICNVTSDSYGDRMDIYYPYIYIPSGLDFGRTEVETTATNTLNINNYGSGKLVIDRLVFDGMEASHSVKLPLVIDSYSAVDVDFNFDMPEGRYDGNLLIYSNDPENGLYKVEMKSERYVCNEFIFNANPDGSLALNLDNRDPIAALQFDLHYPDNVTVEDVETTGRAEGFTVTARLISDNCLRVFCYSLAGNMIHPGYGDVIHIISKYAGDGIYNFTISNVKLSDEAMTDRHSYLSDYPLEVEIGGGMVGLDQISSDPSAENCQFYDLQGHRVDNPQRPGIYIRRQGSKSTLILM